MAEQHNYAVLEQDIATLEGWITNQVLKRFRDLADNFINAGNKGMETKKEDSTEISHSPLTESSTTISEVENKNESNTPASLESNSEYDYP